MKILITCHHFAVASGRYAYNALKRMGHDVHSQGISFGTRIWETEVDPKYAWVPDAPEADWEPELVIHMDGNAEPVRVGDALHVVYGVDNHVRTYWPVFEWDHLFLAHKFGYRMGEPNVTWLPCGYDPVWHVPGPPLKDRPFDAAMVAYDYPQRATLRYALLSHISHLRMTYGLALYEEYTHAYQTAKISLTCSFGGDVAMRVWETAAMGCVLVMDPTHDAEVLGLVDGENCLIYHTEREAIEKVRLVMDHPRTAQSIANAGQAWAAPGTWDARLQVIVDWAEAQKTPKPKKAKARVESGTNEAD